jgi:hypothetical protein
MTDKRTEASRYIAREWKTLEMEEQAHVRALMREGWLAFKSEEYVRNSWGDKGKRSIVVAGALLSS